MSLPTDTDKSAANLENLAQVVIQTIKELSAARQSISPTVMIQALSRKPEIVALLNLPAQTVASPAPPDESADESIAELRGKIQALETQKNRLAGQVDSLQEQKAKIHDFNKRSVTSLIGLLRTPDNQALSDSLNRFKKLLLEGAELEHLEETLLEIRAIVLKEDGTEPRKGQTKSGIWDLFKKSVGSKAPAAPSVDVDFDKLQAAYLGIFAEFHSDLGKEYLAKYSGVQQMISSSRDTRELVSRTDEIIDLIQTYSRLVNDERTQIISFLTEIGSNLAEMETHFTASVDRSSQAQRANNDFNQTLEVQLQDINHSAQFSKSLEEFKGLVLSRITTIKSALEDKRKEDARRMEDAAREMQTLKSNLQILNKEVSQARERTKALERETLIDPLTGIHNRRAYESRMLEELQRYRRYQHLFSVLLFDLDHFKRVNDQYGHPAGDRCLKEIINRIKPALREIDFLARYGGEEFIAILPGTDLENAATVAERLRYLVEKTKFLYQGEVIPVTISIGVTAVLPSDEDEEAVFTRADKAVYEAKRTGRNRVVCSGQN